MDGRCIGLLLPASSVFSLCTIVSTAWELNLFLTNPTSTLSSLTSFDEDLLDSYPYLFPLDLINSIFLFIWWLKFGAVEYIIAEWDYFWSSD